MNTPRINPELISLLKSGEFDVFTCPALTNAYFALPGCKNSSKKGASKLIARHVRALTAEQLVEQTSIDSSRPKTYRLTNKFQEAYGYLNQRTATKYQNTSSLHSELKNKLRGYKVEILEAIGEIEEYEELSLTSAETMPEIQELYRQALDRFSKNQGRVKALENMLLKLESN